jgi:hypothetical protein
MYYVQESGDVFLCSFHQGKKRKEKKKISLLGKCGLVTKPSIYMKGSLEKLILIFFFFFFPALSF